MSAPNALETHMVLKKLYGAQTMDIVQEKLFELNITVVSFTPGHLQEATRVFDRFGKGRHPASLNFGDCIAYALAKVSGQPLFFTGNDFSQTDIPVA